MVVGGAAGIFGYNGSWKLQFAALCPYVADVGDEVIASPEQVPAQNDIYVGAS